MSPSPPPSPPPPPDDAAAAEAAELALLLRAAAAPGELDPARHQALLAAALGAPAPRAAATPPGPSATPVGAEPEPSPAEGEQEEAERLRDALDGRAAHPLAELAVALRAAAAPGAAAPEALTRAWDRTAPRRSGRVIPVVFGAAAAALALAAGVALMLRAAGPPGDDLAGVARSRSAGELFPAGFEGLTPSARVDRLSQARARDLRDNRYHAWGVPR